MRRRWWRGTGRRRPARGLPHRVLRERRLLRECERMIRALAIPAGCADVEGLCRHVSDQRGRPIVLRAVETGGTDHDALGHTATHDIIFYEKNTTPTHQDALIGHALGHVVFDESILPMRHGAGYTGEQERRAEIFSTLIAEHLAGRTPRHEQPADPRGAVYGVPVSPLPGRHR